MAVSTTDNASAATTDSRAKMMSGEWYTKEEEPHQDKARIAALMKRYDAADPGTPECRAIFEEMVGSVGTDTFVTVPFRCDYGYNIHLGNNCYVNFFCVFLDEGEIRIGNHVLIGPHVQLLTVTHPINPDDRLKCRMRGLPIVIEDNVWLGAGAIVLPGITIGHGAVVGAGSVVTKDVPPEVVVAGVPAKFIKSCRDASENNSLDSSKEQ